MKRIPLKSFAVASVFVAGSFGTAITVGAQSINDLKKPKSPLVLDAQGSFYVGGDSVEQNATEVGRPEGGHITLDQMHVQYMIPEGAKSKVPVVLIHGGALTAKNYDTQPDGRMGWTEYFARKRFPVYVAEQIGRARSSFDGAGFNNARAGVTTPSSQPLIPRLTDEAIWNVFRFGPAYGVPYPDQQFPVKYMHEFSKQAVPDLTLTLPVPNPNPKALSDLALSLKGAVLIGHSQSSLYGLEAGLINSKGLKGLVAMEPGQSCSAGPGATPSAPFTNQQIAKLAKVPILVVFGDHLDIPPTPTVNWMAAFNECKTFIARVNAAGGNAKMLYTPDLGIFGNSHMLMNDKNSDKIADLLIKWIEKNVKGQSGGHDDDDDDHHHH